MWSLFHPLGDLLLPAVAVIFALLSDKLWLIQRRPATPVVDRIAAHPVASYLLIGFLSFVGSAAVSTWRFPEPQIHDEFSYLLAADTFASGRLTNPSHPKWKHFETFHILQKPTYASRYPPAQGFVLAVGQVLGGHPVVGVWLGAALGSVAICWMLVAWLPPRWALYGSLLAVLRIGVAGYWSQSYFGGWMGVLGGALLLGALRRVVERPQVVHSAVLALGLAILANSRPFEGLILALPCAFVLVVFLTRCYLQGERGNLRLVLLPVGLVLVLNLVWMGMYNRTVTGDPLKMPHQLYSETYMTVPYLLSLPAEPRPAYRHPEMARFHSSWEQSVYEKRLSPEGWFEAKWRDQKALWKVYLGVALSIPLLFLPWSRPDPWMGFALFSLALYVAVSFFITWSLPHYSAPFAPLVFFLTGRGLQAAADSDRWHGFGRILPRVLLISSLGALVFGLLDPQDLWPPPNPGWHLRRVQILDELEVRGGKHLVIVRYRRDHPRHDEHQEWVFNQSDIDSAAVVWARDRTRAQNRRLMKHFEDRQVWLLEPDVAEPRLQPYKDR